MTYDYDGIERRLKALSGLVASLAPSLAGWFDEYVDAGEYGLAVEIAPKASSLTRYVRSTDIVIGSWLWL